MATFKVRAKEWFARRHPAVKVAVVLGGGAVTAAVGYAAAPIVGALASLAGFGAAGGTLSGAAASSAGLAAMGGGSIASGGLGMAGGTAVVTAVAGAAGTGAVTYGATKVHEDGVRSADYARRAREQEVADGDIHVES